jgi:hypothetical protein
VNAEPKTIKKRPPRRQSEAVKFQTLNGAGGPHAGSVDHAFGEHAPLRDGLPINDWVSLGDAVSAVISQIFVSYTAPEIGAYELVFLPHPKKCQAVGRKQRRCS